MKSYTGQPECKTLLFGRKEATGYYTRISCPPFFEKLPIEIKIEKTVKTALIKSELICRGRIVNKKYSFFTGIILIKPLIYFGDHYHPHEKVKKSFIIFKFSPDYQSLSIYYFNHFKVYPNKREKFINDFFNRK